jgi:hypothetical protein
MEEQEKEGSEEKGGGGGCSIFVNPSSSEWSDKNSWHLPLHYKVSPLAQYNVTQDTVLVSNTFPPFR